MKGSLYAGESGAGIQICGCISQHALYLQGVNFKIWFVAGISQQ